MKTITRYIRRRRSASPDGPMFKKRNNNEESFFGENTREPFFSSAPTNIMQRKCASCEEEEKVHRSKDEQEEDKTVQKKQENGVNSYADTTPYVHTLGGKGSRLPESSRHFFEERMGCDFSEVSIHTDAEAAHSASEINAKAYTVDHHIVFNDGQYNPESFEGKKLLAHELAHVIQQDEQAVIARKEDEKTEAEPKEKPCTAGSVDLEAETTAGYHKGAGTVAKEKRMEGQDCPDCKEGCVSITGTLQVPFKVATKINLPFVPGGLSLCQQERVKSAINGPLSAHEEQHVKAFETFNGTAPLPVAYKGCESNYNTYLESLANQEFERRKVAADAKSAALDPFSIPVDLCCEDKEVKKK